MSLKNDFKNTSYVITCCSTRNYAERPDAESSAHSPNAKSLDAQPLQWHRRDRDPPEVSRTES